MGKVFFYTSIKKQQQSYFNYIKSCYLILYDEIFFFNLNGKKNLPNGQISWKAQIRGKSIYFKKILLISRLLLLCNVPVQIVFIKRLTTITDDESVEQR